MARTDLSAMLSRLPDEPTPAPEPAAVKPAAVAPSERMPAARKPRRTPAAEPASAASTGYLSFERKEARLRADQYAQLTQEARRLNKAKRRGGERITENTLIRVAIDLLLSRADRLAGATEDEIRNSVTL